MRRKFTGSRIPREVTERLHICAAVAAAQVMEEHVCRALEVVSEGAGRAPVDRLLAAYGRLHHLEEEHQRLLRERVLAALGRDPGTQHDIAGARSPLQRIARRLRGRVHYELREWMERHAAQVQLSLIDIHVRHALDFVATVEGYATAGEAFDLYESMLRLRGTVAEIVRLMGLRTLHETRPRADESLQPGSAFPLRVADSGA